jgi:pilus assembly protein CpaC
MQLRKPAARSLAKRARHVLGLATACLIASAGVASAQQQGPRELTVEVGEQETISADGVRSYSEGARGIVQVRLTDDQSRFVIVGQRPGDTSLLLIMRDGSQVQYRLTDPGGEVEEEAGGVQARENIRLDLYFVLLSDTYSHAIGINFPGSIGSNQSTAQIQTQWATGESVESQVTLALQSALPRIDIAQSNGWARLYRQAALITANGTDAQFSAGGEINVAVQGALSGQVQKIEFGTEIQCQPRYDPETGRIELRIQANVSDLADDRGTGIPGRTTSTLNTIVNLELGQTIVLGGLISRSEGRNRSGLPGLSQIPVLGALFGSHSRRFEESEALMFIVPSVVNAIPLQQRNRIQEAIRLYEEYRGGVDEVELMEQPRVQGVAPRTTPAED